MELRAVRVREGAPGSGRVRLEGEICSDGATVSETLWFEFPESLAPGLSASGNPWLLALLPHAAAARENLRLSLPVDPILARNALELMRIWKAWDPTRHVAAIEADLSELSAGRPGRRTAVFFSGGVDSFFTLLGEQSGDAEKLPIDDLLYVHGFDIDVERPEGYERMRRRFEGIAESFGKGLVCVATNLRKTAQRNLPWAPLAHGCAMGAVGLAMENRFSRLLVSSTWDLARLKPIGSHPMTDPLFSTSGTRFFHEGAGFSRAQKLDRVFRSDAAMAALSVCFRSGGEGNCGDCEKCFRTMLMLEALGHSSACAAFPRRLDLAVADRVYSPPRAWDYYRDIEALARASGRPDVERAAQRVIRSSRRATRMLRAADALRGKRLVWRASSPLRKAAMAGALR